MPDDALENYHRLAAEWAEHFSRALETMAGQKPEVAIEGHTLRSEESGVDPVLWWQSDYSLPAGARLWAGATAKSWQAISLRVLKAAGVEGEDPESARSTYLEILNQSLSSFAKTLSGRAGREISVSNGSEAAPDADSHHAYLARFTFADAGCEVQIAFTEEFTDTVVQNPPADAATAAPPEPKSTQSSTTPVKSVSMDLLLDVELPVSVSFGRAQLHLKDVLKLTTGSIIELNRTVSEPVEIIVNNCVIARGEVVVVEGNFGVRIRQVISRQERMRTLK